MVSENSFSRTMGISVPHPDSDRDVRPPVRRIRLRCADEYRRAGINPKSSAENTAIATVNVAVPSASGGGNEYPLQYVPGAGARGLTIAGYALAADSVYGTVVIGTCSYYTQTSGSATNFSVGTLSATAPIAPRRPAPIMVPSHAGTWPDCM